MFKPKTAFLNLKREWRKLFIIGTPIILAQLAQIGLGVTDVMMSGKASSTDLAGVAIGNSLWVPVFLFLLGFSMALTSIFARYVGQKDFLAIRWQFVQGFWLVVLLGIVSLFVIQQSTHVLSWFDMGPEEKAISSDYLVAFSYAMPAILLVNLMRSFSDGFGNTKPAMLISAAILIINIPFNYVLIYGVGIFPKLGGAGCGWASAISAWSGVLIYAVYLYNGRHKEHIRQLKFVKPSLLSIKEITSLGIPIGFSLLIESSVFSLIALFVAKLGAQVLASHQISLSITSVLFMVPLSLSMAMTIRIGHLLGARKFKQARLHSLAGILLAVLISLFYAVLLLLGASLIVGLYTNEQVVKDLAISLLFFAAVFQLADAVQVAAMGALRGYKDAKIPAFIAVFAYWFGCLPTGYYLAFYSPNPMGVQGFWIGLIIGLSLAALLLGIRLASTSKKALI